jgi:hypothetical protein
MRMMQGRILHENTELSVTARDLAEIVDACASLTTLPE